MRYERSKQTDFEKNLHRTNLLHNAFLTDLERQFEKIIFVAEQHAKGMHHTVTVSRRSFKTFDS